MEFEHKIIQQRESMQDDIICILEGVDDKILNEVCRVVIDRCNILIEQLKVSKLEQTI